MFLSDALILAQGGTVEDMIRVLFWCAVLLGTALLLAGAFYLIRKRLMSGEEESASGLDLGFSLSDLRELHSRGQLSDEEFDYAKRKMAARARAQLGDANDAGEAGRPLHLADPEDPDDSPRRLDDEDIPF